MYKLFRPYGKIKEVRIENKAGIIIFQNPKTAVEVAEKKFIQFNNDNLELLHRKYVFKNESKFFFF